MKNIFKKENRIVLIVALVCLVIVGVVASYTYSFFAVETSNSSIIAGEAESMGLTIKVTKTAPTDNSRLIPQLDAYITSAIVGRNGSCIDDNNNTVCHTYQITLTNNGSSSTTVTGTLTLDNKNNSNLKWAIFNYIEDSETGNTVPSLVGDIKTPEETTLTTNDTFASKESKDYYVVVWISETGLSQTDTGSYSGVVNFSNAQNLDTGSLAYATLTSLGLTNSIKTDTPDFSKTSCSSGCEEATVGIYESEDDLGTSYYFRGDVTNDYVKFGKNSSGSDMYWRIIRINGDGTVRMIYMGTDVNATSLTPVGTSAFNANNDNNTYVGYMYGSAGASTYADTHSNKYNSTIKTYLEGIGNNDGWYYENIVATGYSDYVADAIYCNDRSLSSGTGIGTTETYYGAYGRIVNSTTPTLKCEQVNDRFTQNTTIGEATGNGLLRYPVGLITIDEVSMAGNTWNSSNSEYYLYTNEYYWTMTPFYFDGLTARVFRVASGDLDGDYVNNYFYGVLPTLSLNSNAIIDGEGTTTDPFVVEV